MPDYSIVSNTRFNPFSYDEMLKPVLIAEQAHREAEEAYSDLMTKSGNWDKMLNPEVDAEAYNMYTTYAKALEEEADRLAKQGLSPTSRQSMLNMKGRYAKEIVPIENAYKKREEEIKRQQEMLDKTGGNTVFTRDARTTSLDKYLYGNPESYGQVNLDDVIKYGIAGGKAISERYIRTSEGRAFQNSYYNLITEKGFTPQEALQILNNPEQYPEFSKFINDELRRREAVKGESPYSDLDRDRIESALMEGINLGITYDRKDNLHDDWRSKAVLSADLADRNAERDFTRKVNYEAIKNAYKRQQEIKDLVNQIIPEGASTEISEDLKRLEGLRPSVRVLTGKNGKVLEKVKGISTKKRDELNREYKKALEKWNTYSDAEKREASHYAPSSVAQNVPGKGIYESLGKSMHDSVGKSAPKAYADYKKYMEAKEALEAEDKWLATKGDEYKVYDPNDIQRAFNIGTALEKTQSGQQNQTMALNLNSSSYGDVRTGLQTLITTGKGNVGLVSSKGNKLDADDSFDIIGEKSTGIGVTFEGKKVYLSATDQDKKRYKIVGTKAINAFNDKMTTANESLMDFSGKTIKDRSITLSNVDLMRIAQGDLSTLPGDVSYDVGNGLKAFTVRSMNGSDIVNIVIDGNQVIGMSSLSDELYNGGKTRRSYLETMTGSALRDLLPSIAKTPQASEGEK